MSIERLTSAARAAGFAMVHSDQAPALQTQRAERPTVPTVWSGDVKTLAPSAPRDERINQMSSTPAWRTWFAMMSGRATA